MSERAALISAVLDDLADDTPRLVFADWLEENGESERAEFVRCQIEAAALPEKGRSKSKPAKRAAALLKKHETRWREAVGLVNWGGNYVRGFLTGVRFLSREFADRAGAVLALEPAELHLRLHNSTDDDDTPVTPKWVAAFAKNPALRSVVRVELNCGGFREHFARLMKSPHLGNLKQISCFQDRIGPKGVKAIAESPSPFVLDYLNLNTGIGSGEADEEEAQTVAAVKILTTHPRFASLGALGLPFNSLGEKSVELLLNSKTLSPTLKLGLGEDNLFDPDDYEERLAGRFRMVDYV